jgi:hypothetical protein
MKTQQALGEKKVLAYPLDLERPYKILRYNGDGRYTVMGFAKILRATKWMKDMQVDFGGHPSIFFLEKKDFLTKDHKASLRWVKKHLGQRQHDIELERIYDSVIAGHTYNNG